MKKLKKEKKRNIFVMILIRITILLLIIGIAMLIFLFKGEVKSVLPKSIQEQYSIEIKEYEERNVFILSPKQEKKKTELVVLYIHGGSYVGELTNEHWNFLSDILNDVGCTLIVPDYPLTPKYTYQDVFKMMGPLYKEIINNVGSEHFVVMGDSAGGGLSLALSQQMGEEGIEQPKKLILLSPWLDVRMQNPEIDKVAKNDPILNKTALILSGERYAGEEGKESYLVNPILGPLNKLKDVILYTGTYDMLNPDAHLLVEKAKEEGITIELREVEKAVHIWMLNRHKNVGYDHAEETYQEIVKLLRNLGEENEEKK